MRNIILFEQTDKNQKPRKLINALEIPEILKIKSLFISFRPLAGAGCSNNNNSFEFGLCR